MEDNDDKLEFNEFRRFTDEEVRNYLQQQWHLQHPSHLLRLEKEQRTTVVLDSLNLGIRCRQLSRLTGLSFSAVQRINERVKGSDPLTR